jgi:hypothetical protein
MDTQFGVAPVHQADNLNSVDQGPVHIRFESAVIQSVDHLNQIAADPVNAGRTFQVTKEVFEHFIQKLRFLPKPEGDIQRINRLLGIALAENESCGMTRTCICQRCGHEFSFADHVESALHMGLHTAEDLKQLFVGSKYFLTIDTDKQRDVLCIKCGEKSLLPHCCYGSKTYGYAEAD